jgi:hypothetical protein
VAWKSTAARRHRPGDGLLGGGLSRRLWDVSGLSRLERWNMHHTGTVNWSRVLDWRRLWAVWRQPGPKLWPFGQCPFPIALQSIPFGMHAGRLLMPATVAPATRAANRPPDTDNPRSEPVGRSAGVRHAEISPDVIPPLGAWDAERQGSLQAACSSHRMPSMPLFSNQTETKQSFWRTHLGSWVALLTARATVGDTPLLFKQILGCLPAILPAILPEA